MATATQTPISAPGRSLAERLDNFFIALGQGMNAYTTRHARMRQLRALDAKTDAELAEMGLTRDQIPAYVFRDVFYI